MVGGGGGGGGGTVHGIIQAESRAALMRGGKVRQLRTWERWPQPPQTNECTRLNSKFRATGQQVSESFTLGGSSSSPSASPSTSIGRPSLALFHSAARISFCKTERHWWGCAELRGGCGSKAQDDDSAAAVFLPLKPPLPDLEGLEEEAGELVSVLLHGAVPKAGKALHGPLQVLEADGGSLPFADGFQAKGRGVSLMIL